MNRTAELISEPAPTVDNPVVYEQPLGERLRTFLRLEYLYQQLLFNMQKHSPWATRAAVTSLLDVVAILSRGDLRKDIMKELERQIYVFDRFQNTPNVDEGRLDDVMRNLQALRNKLNFVGPQYLTGLRESEFLNSVKHRSAIPGGTCEFDLPDFSYWLRKPYERRLTDMQEWTKNIRPLCEAVGQLMWLLRNSGQTVAQVAVNGVFQYTLGRDMSAGMLRVSLSPGTALFPEISGSRHRFTIRFMDWSNVVDRARQTTEDVPFSLTIC
ncbi:MAG: cell division protein ZapD [Gammaproteobacteria bacterium]